MISNIQGGAASTVGNVDGTGYVVPSKQVSEMISTVDQTDTDKTLVNNSGASKGSTDTATMDDQSFAVADNKEKQDSSGKKKLSKEDVGQMTNALNNFMATLNCDLEFKYYDKLDQLSVKMVDQKTNTVIKEFPPEDIMKAMIKTREWIGVFLDKKA